MTADLKDVLAATLPGILPTLMVLIGILTNKNDINHVRTEISSMRGEISNVRTDLRAEISSVRGEISSVRGEIASVRNELRAEISGVRTELGAIRVQSHADTLTLVNISNEMDKRVGRLEDKG